MVRFCVSDDTRDICETFFFSLLCLHSQLSAPLLTGQQLVFTRGDSACFKSRRNVGITAAAVLRPEGQDWGFGSGLTHEPTIGACWVSVSVRFMTGRGFVCHLLTWKHSAPWERLDERRFPVLTQRTALC